MKVMEKFWLYKYQPQTAHTGRYWLLHSEPPRDTKKVAVQRADLLKQSFNGAFDYAVVQAENPPPQVPFDKAIYLTAK